MKNLIKALIFSMIVFMGYSCSNSSSSTPQRIYWTDVNVCIPAGEKITFSWSQQLKENVMNVPIDTTYDGKKDIEVQIQKQDILSYQMHLSVLSHMYSDEETHCLDNCILERYNDGSIGLRKIM